MNQVLWSANFCHLASLHKRQRRRVFPWCRSQRDLHLFCKFRMTSTWTQNVETSSCHDPDFLVIVRNHLEITVPVGWALVTNYRQKWVKGGRGSWQWTTLLLVRSYKILSLFEIMLATCVHGNEQRLLVGWLLNVPATCECISGTDLLRQFYVLPHWDGSCRSNFPSHPVTVYWHRADQSQRWP